MRDNEEFTGSKPSAWRKFWLGPDEERNVVAGEALDDKPAAPPHTSREPEYLASYSSPAAPMTNAIVVGLLARLVFWAMVLLIVGNCAAYLFSEGNAFAGIFSVVLFPLTTFAWPFFSPADASAWPLDGSNFLILYFVIAAIAYPISTLVGGLRSV